MDFANCYDVVMGYSGLAVEDYQNRGYMIYDADCQLVSEEIFADCRAVLDARRDHVDLYQAAKENGIMFKAILLDSKEAAQNAPTPVTTYALFKDGEYISNEQMNESRFLKLVGKK